MTKGRQGATPYPVQVKKLLAEMRQQSGAGLVSAKTLLTTVHHPARKKLSSQVGDLNKVLHTLWSEGDLVSYAKDGSVLREPDFVTEGSAACEHPQIFGLPGTSSPVPGYVSVTYAENSLAGHSDRSADSGSSDAELPSVAMDPAAASDSEPEKSITIDPFSWHANGPAPEWLPPPLVEEWVTRPGALAFLREGLDRAASDEKRQLILTGLQRKGSVSRNTRVARRLADLCFKDAVWWDRCARWAYEDYDKVGQAPGTEDLARLPEALDELKERHPVGALVLACILSGLEADEIKVLALEAGEELSQGSAESHETPFEALNERLRISHDEINATRAELRTARREQKAAERRVEALRAELSRAREVAQDAAADDSELEDLRTDLAEVLAEKTALSESVEALADEQSHSRELEAQVEELHAFVESLEAALEASSDEAGRRMRAEQDLQDALRTISEQNVRIAGLQRDAGRLPSPSSAASLARLLDAAVGALVAEASSRIASGEAAPDDGLLLGFASHFLDFKLKLTAQTGDVSSLPSRASVVEEPPPALESGEDELPAAVEQDQPRNLESADEVLEAAGANQVVEAAEHEAPVPAGSVAQRTWSRLGWIVRPLGGAGEIGGSAVLVQTPSGESVLLDVGQRVRGLFGNTPDDDFHFLLVGSESLSAILVTHAHIDHTGSLPVFHRNQVARQGTPIPVFMSEPTAQLARIMMNDSAKIQQANHQLVGDSDLAVGMLGDKPAYDVSDVGRVMEAVNAVPALKAIEIPGTNLIARFAPVSHVLGSCAIHLTDTRSGLTLLYTGDLGPIQNPQLSLQDFGLGSLDAADLVIMESTYGAPPVTGLAPAGRKSPVSRRERNVAELCKIAGEAVRRGGFVLLPTFSLGRAQELARILQSRMLNKDLPEAPMYVGGMAETIMQVYVEYAERRSKDSGAPWVTSGQFPRTQSLLDKRLEKGLTFEETAAELLADFEPGYILASPAMLTGGWSLTFANLLVDDPRHAIIFTGYLPRDDRTLRALSEWRKGAWYTLDGPKRKIECEWAKVGLSAHASYEDLRDFARHMARKAAARASFGVVHGTTAAQNALAADISGMDGVIEARSLMNGDTWTVRRK